MPYLLDYKHAVAKLTAGGFISLYHNSGAFGFPQSANVHTIGWTGAADETIRPEMAPMIRRVVEPYGATMARLAQLAWTSHLPGECWLSPKSHWHYEMHYGNRHLLEELLPLVDVNPAAVADRNDGSPVVFTPPETDAMFDTVFRLLGGLISSDFQLTFPTRATVCTVHHHEQLWWQTTDAAVVGGIDSINPVVGSGE
jgi:hypothetical protein